MRILVYIYVLAAFALSFGSLFTESYPALFWIDILAPEPGDKYPIAITGLLTALCLLLPMVIVMYVLKVIRNRKIAPVVDESYFNKSGIHFSRIKQMQNRLVSSPVFIDGIQQGRIDSGKKLFIELAPGTYEVEVGGKRERSEKLIVQVEANKHAQVEIEIVPNGLRSKHVISNI
ncbi:hypothetical protein D3C87_06240 [compost metagenome]